MTENYDTRIQTAVIKFRCRQAGYTGTEVQITNTIQKSGKKLQVFKLYTNIKVKVKLSLCFN
jgi:hypothetical protein